MDGLSHNINRIIVIYYAAVMRMRNIETRYNEVRRTYGKTAHVMTARASGLQKKIVLGGRDWVDWDELF